MNIKDFKVGETAYLMNFHDRLLNENTTIIDDVVVSSIGRKYVKVKYPKSNYDISFYKADEVNSYLTEKKDYGTLNYLFQSKQDINEYRERKELARWISNNAQYLRENQYSIEQLREIKRILENSKD